MSTTPTHARAPYVVQSNDFIENTMSSLMELDIFYTRISKLFKYGIMRAWFPMKSRIDRTFPIEWVNDRTFKIDRLGLWHTVLIALHQPAFSNNSISFRVVRVQVLDPSIGEYYVLNVLITMQIPSKQWAEKCKCTSLSRWGMRSKLDGIHTPWLNGGAKTDCTVSIMPNCFPILRRLRKLIRGLTWTRSWMIWSMAGPLTPTLCSPLDRMWTSVWATMRDCWCCPIPSMDASKNVICDLLIDSRFRM